MMIREEIRIGVLQLECKLNQPKSNVRRALDYINRAIEQDVDLVCLPEAFVSSGNLMDVELVAETIPGETTDLLCAKAREGRLHIVAGILERDGTNFYSSAVLIDRTGAIAGKYRRIHTFYLEKRYFSNGAEAGPFVTELGIIGMIIGYDIYFPESCRSLFKKGAQIIVCPALLPERFSYVTNHLAVARAMENKCCFIFVSGTGENPFAGFRYMGGSLITCDPLFLEEEQFDFLDGNEMLARASRAEELIQASVNIKKQALFNERNSILRDLETARYG